MVENKEQKKEPYAPEFIYEDVSREERDRRITELRPFFSKFMTMARLDELAAFLENLKEKYGGPASRECELYHFASGSTIDDNRRRAAMIFDFPGEDSIEKFLRENADRE